MSNQEQIFAENTMYKVLHKVRDFVSATKAKVLAELHFLTLHITMYCWTTLYREVYKKGNKLSVELRDILTNLRAIYQKCDIEAAKIVRDASGGWWKFVKLSTDMDIPYTKNQKPEFTLLLTFCSIGSFRKALERSRGKCVFTNEILEQSLYTYSENFNIEPRELNLDYLETFVYQTNMEKIPEINCLVAGFPCKSFSSLGKRQRRGSGKIALALTDPAFGLLIFDTMKIIKERKPEFYILENVHQFVTDENVWKDTILRAMTDPTFKPTDVKGGDNFDKDLPPGKGYNEYVYDEKGEKKRNRKGELITYYVVGQEDIFAL